MSPPTPKPKKPQTRWQMWVDAAKRDMLKQLLQHTNGSWAEAARIMGTGRSFAHGLGREYGLLPYAKELAYKARGGALPAGGAAEEPDEPSEEREPTDAPPHDNVVPLYTDGPRLDLPDNAPPFDNSDADQEPDLDGPDGENEEEQDEDEQEEGDGPPEPA